MNDLARQKALEEGRLFDWNGIIFAAQVPDDSLGCSASRCSNCGEKTTYSKIHCDGCKSTFAGPFGFPQLSEWSKMTVEEKNDLAALVFSEKNHGRMEFLE